LSRKLEVSVAYVDTVGIEEIVVYGYILDICVYWAQRVGAFGGGALFIEEAAGGDA